MERDNIVHGFKVGGMGADGKPSVFVHSFFPDQIINIEPLSPSGSRITVKYNGGDDHVQWNVVPSVEQIEKMMEHCRMLDDQASAVDSYGAVKGGKRIS